MFSTALALALTAFAPLAGAAKTPPPPPNILLLFPDEWRFDWDSFRDDNGRVPLTLPILRSLAARGTRFTHSLQSTHTEMTGAKRTNIASDPISRPAIAGGKRVRAGRG